MLKDDTIDGRSYMSVIETKSTLQEMADILTKLRGWGLDGKDQELQASTARYGSYYNLLMDV